MAAIPRKVAWAFRAVFVVVAAGLLLLGTTPSLHGQTLETIRSDVREPTPAASSTPQSSNSRSSGGDADDDSPFGELKSDLFFFGAKVVGMAVSSPIWLPHFLLNDNYDFVDFHQFPYDDTTNPPETFPFAVRLDADYVDAFDNLDRLNGHLLDQHGIEVRIRRPLPTSWRTPGRWRGGSIMDGRFQRDVPLCSKRTSRSSVPAWKSIG